MVQIVPILMGVALLFWPMLMTYSFDETEAELEERLGKITESLVSRQRCFTDNDCRENSFCYDNDHNRVGLCKCQAGYELLLRNRTYYTCKTLSKWGEDCELTEQCIDNLGSLALCDGTCQCQPQTSRFPFDGRCHEINLLEDFCRSDANCVLEDGSYAFCADGQCQCNIGLRPTLDRKHCVIARALGENCTDDYQCSFTANSVCRDVCRCSIDYVISRNNTACLKAATYFNETCEEHVQCSEFLRDSVCSNNYCGCQDGYHSYENKCVRTVNVGSSCGDKDECIFSQDYAGILDCLEGVCQCLPEKRNEPVCGGASHLQTMVSVFLIVFQIFCCVRFIF
ncbi:hypothetical protein ABEB36_006321 [Hypothenemus hampei]|uniref:EB domain-containing protein n=1 Tax=Hypothenemus hampei TaxID=57062 RepID=A0ABD1EQ61_HYPHA